MRHGAIGSFVGELRDNVQAYVRAGAAGVPAPFMYFSGHDSTLSPLLSAMGKPGGSWPPFTSSLVFELWKRGGDAEGKASSIPSLSGNSNQASEERSEMRRRRMLLLSSGRLLWQ